ncbi:hypothetical protein CRUP_028931, partial [Coryphaenoides rupestris]
PTALSAAHQAAQGGHRDHRCRQHPHQGSADGSPTRQRRRKRCSSSITTRPLPRFKPSQSTSWTCWSVEGRSSWCLPTIRWSWTPSQRSWGRRACSTSASMAAPRQQSASSCVRTSSTARAAAWRCSPSLPPTWASRCTPPTWWCSPSSSGTPGCLSRRRIGCTVSVRPATWTYTTSSPREPQTITCDMSSSTERRGAVLPGV